MWCPEGYLTVLEVCRTALGWVGSPGSKANETLGDAPYDEIASFDLWMTNALLSLLSSDIRACLPSGNLVRLAPEAFVFNYGDGIACKSLGLYFYPLYVFPPDRAGRIELASGEFEHICKYDLVIRASRVPSMLDALAGSPLCISESLLPTRLDRLVDWIIDARAKELDFENSGTESSERSADIAMRIASAFSQGLFRTKSEAQQLFGRGMKVAEWQALWREACALRPDLSKPGPRS